MPASSLRAAMTMVTPAVGWDTRSGGWRSSRSDIAMNDISSAGMYATSITAANAAQVPTYPLRSRTHGSESQTDTATHASAKATEAPNFAATETYHPAVGPGGAGLPVAAPGAADCGDSTSTPCRTMLTHRHVGRGAQALRAGCEEVAQS